jgi:cobalt-zinc-cadmium efflux system membrane fusion protein
MKTNTIAQGAALLLTALLWAGCRPSAHTEEHAGHDHGPGEDHGARQAAAEEDAHVGHDHGPDENHDAEGHESPMCGEHGVPEAECGICSPDAVVHLKPGESMKVRMPSPESARLAGIETAPPADGAISDGIECYAELAFNQNRLAQVGSPVGGILRGVLVDLGSPVQEGQPVARIWSADIAGTVARAVLSHQTLERERKLHADGIAAAKDVQEAEAAHRSACQQARTLGFSEEDIDAMGRMPEESVLLDVRAPFAGEIIERNAVHGSLVEAGVPLFTLADRSTMWAMLQIPEVHLSRVRTGQRVELSVDSLPGRTFTGKLTWIAAQVDERTRMARARAEIPNPDGELRDRMFARARIITRHAESALLLPAPAVQRVDNTTIVFVRRTEDLYDARAVSLGARHDDRVEVLAGLNPNEPVVVGQAFALKSQLLLSRLGAGCAHE